MGRFPTTRGTPHKRASGDESFKQSQVNFRPPNPATNEKDREMYLYSRKLYRQQRTRVYSVLPFSLLLSRQGISVRISRSGEKPHELKGELMHLSPRDTIWYLNQLKENEETATLPAHEKAPSSK
ncbi:hypothetical protein Scep_021632 [Stephania cephalantha]|uniref:Uncharacterized protein n=1 Tax=Stephania cephalantha TaxID=152367 RepID=A0AAP0HX06_9MAGN